MNESVNIDHNIKVIIKGRDCYIKKIFKHISLGCIAEYVYKDKNNKEIVDFIELKNLHKLCSEQECDFTKIFVEAFKLKCLNG